MAGLKKVIDASVAVKWFSKEQHSVLALMLLEDCRNGKIDLVVPDLLFYEVANVLKCNRLSEKDVQNALSSLFNLGLGMSRVDEIIMAETVRCALQHNTSIYDAAYVALSKLFECELITADEKLLNKNIGNITHIKNYQG